MGTETKHTIDIVYGAVPYNKNDFSVHSFFPDTSSHPSPELLINLAKLPEGSVVAIDQPDTTEGNKRVMINGLDFEFRPTPGTYWKDIKEVCETRRLQVVGLTNLTIFGNWAERMWIEGDLQKDFSTLMNQRNDLLYGSWRPKTDEALETEILKTRKKLFEQRAHKEYIYEILEAQAVEDKLLQVKPTMAILHQRLASSLARNNPNSPIKVGAYYEEAKVTSSDGVFYDNGYTGLSDHPFNPINVNNRIESAIRAHRIVTTGKVLENGPTPDYVGTWRTFLPEQGFFWMYVASKDNGARSIGIIEDYIGTADWKGVITEQKINFIKKYRPEQSYEAPKGEITYEGQRKKHKGEIYEGNYQIPHFGGDNFIMNAGSELLTPKLP